MLDERTVIFARTKLHHILGGKELMPEALKERCMAMYGELYQMKNSEKYDGLFLQFRENPEFHRDAMDLLRELLSKAATPGIILTLRCVMMKGSYSYLGSGDFWADCLPSWEKGRSRYGAIPADDILIKLIADKA